MPILRPMLNGSVDVQNPAGSGFDGIVVTTVPDNMTLDAQRIQLAALTVTGKTVTLPADPQDGDIVSVKVIGAVVCTIAANAGQTIEGGASVPAGQANAGTLLQYYAAGSAWLAIAVYAGIEP